MENNGKANVMENLKAKLAELKENFRPPIWTLVFVAVFIAIPMSGGTLALGTFLIDASFPAMLLILVGVVGYVHLIYMVIYNFFKTLDKTYVVKPVHNDEDLS